MQAAYTYWSNPVDGLEGAQGFKVGLGSRGTGAERCSATGAQLSQAHLLWEDPAGRP